MRGKVAISGHRGARGLWPENTLAGFAGALALGVDAVECDVMLTADARLAVTHDRQLDPDLARGPDGRWDGLPASPVAAMLAATLRACDVGRPRPGGHVASRFPEQMPVDGERIPFLDEVLEVMAGGDILLDVELKTEADEPAARVTALVRAVLAAFAARAGVRVAVRSFDWRGLHAIRAAQPALPLGWLTETGGAEDLRAVLDAARPGDCWAPAHETLSAAAIARAARAGLRVEPWTVNAPDAMRRLIAQGVDGVCTDRPDIARALLGELGLPRPRPYA